MSRNSGPREPGSTPANSIVLTREKPPLRKGDLYLFLPEKEGPQSMPPIGFVTIHRGVSMRVVEQHRCGAVELTVVSDPEPT